MDISIKNEHVNFFITLIVLKIQAILYKDRKTCPMLQQNGKFAEKTVIFSVQVDKSLGKSDCNCFPAKV